MTSPQPGPAPRTLAESLAAMTDEALVRLFLDRPDVVHLLPQDMASLAARCAGPMSVRLAWERLTELEQQLLEVLAAHDGPLSWAGLLAAMAPEPTEDERIAIAAALQRCRDLALVWGDEEALRAVAGVSAQLGPAPCGLETTDRSHLPRIRRYSNDPASLFDELAAAPERARAALDRLLWGPPRGRVPNADRPVSEASANTAVEWLLARDLLLAEGPDTVVLPREIALLLRHGRYVRSVAMPPRPPALEGSAGVADCDAAAGMHALQFTRSMGRMLDLLDEGTTRALRSGGIYQRDAAELGRRLHLSVRETAAVADTAAAAALIDTDPATGVWRPTRNADAWRVLPEQRQWAVLALAWRDSPSHAPLAAEPESDNRILSDSLHTPGIAEIRRLTLALAATVSAGSAVDAEALVSAIGWHRPRLHGRDLPGFVTEILRDGEFLGVLGRGAMSRSGRLLADPARDAAAIASAVAWPTLVDRVVVQADLTATALGPMTPQAEARIGLLADRESSGAGTVYRISAASLSRGFDAGMATAEVLVELGELSLTELPLALTTLVHDVGRRHGAVRVQAAASVITSDDDSALAAVVSDRSLLQLRLHRIAAGVAISPLPAAEVAAALRKAGVSAVSAAIAPAARPKRLPSPHPVIAEPIDAAHLAAAVRTLRAGESARAALTGPARTVPASPHDLMAMLTQAIREGNRVWLDVSDPTGERRLRLVEPITLRAGTLTGFDQREHRVIPFPLSRIAGISVVEGDGQAP